MSLLQEEDWQLFARAAGDHQALAQLFKRHKDYIYRLAWGLLYDPDAAHDVVQEVFFKLGSGRLKAKPKAQFTTWLYQVALNLSREQQRKMRKSWGDDNALRYLADQPDKRADMGRVESLNDLEKALRALSGRQREVVVLRYLEGFSTRETAEIMVCREGTVKAHLHKATEKLRGYLEPI